jgi:hypothetical protein
MRGVNANSSHVSEGRFASFKSRGVQEGGHIFPLHQYGRMRCSCCYSRALNYFDLSRDLLLFFVGILT